MRKVTEQIKKAFFEGKRKSIGNTWTDGKSVWLHTNKIITSETLADGSKRIIWTLAGWNTVTTRERLNGILGDHFCGVFQRNYEPMVSTQYGDKVINANSLHNTYGYEV